ncbi:hypothetical protein [Saccharothrix obliqua]|uniref:hypothetical protein n=1 Tax=Saccharothrix obliqua TaxID=2861747 RepID=UPI001C603EF0|nr:hypothetical protein [Saccharothrix obliqua]MBW4721287.1 hypothetical protein [Saccharothrix obliqua]
MSTSRGGSVPKHPPHQVADPDYRERQWESYRDAHREALREPFREPRREPRRAPRRTGPPPRPRGRLLTTGRALRFLVLSLVVTAVVEVVEPTATPLTAAGCAVAMGVVPLLVRVLRERRAPVVRAALVLLLVCGAGAYLGTAAVDRVTAREAVVADRLVSPATGGIGPLVVTVEQVAVTAHFTKVTVAAVNRSALAAKVSVVDSCRLMGTDGVELRLDGLFEVVRERFFLDVPGGGAAVRHTVAFPGALPPDVGGVVLGCGSVSWTGADPGWSAHDLLGKPLRVVDIRLTAAG